MSLNRGALSLVLVLTLGAAACGGGNVQFAEPAPSPLAAFDVVLVRASGEAGAGRYDQADKLLSDFAAQNPAAPGVVDVIYWRAIYKLDPANTAGSPREAATLLDAYLSSPTSARRAEAMTLRRVATAAEVKPATPPPVATPVKADNSAAEKAKDEEIGRLKEELAKANAELERIKRRLAKP